jgi:hypothetical protein
MLRAMLPPSSEEMNAPTEATLKISSLSNQGRIFDGCIQRNDGAAHARREKILLWLQADSTGPVPFAKIFRFAPDPNHFHICAHPTPLKGRIAIVTDVGRDAMDASGASDEGAYLRTAKPCGPDASTLAFKSVQETAPVTVTIKPDHRGELGGNR